MQRIASSNRTRCRCWLASFTLIELLVVMLIIAILTALTLAAAAGAMGRAARSRAAGEIHAYSSGLESYKIDNGIYPSGTTNLVGGTNGAYPLDPSVNGGTYQQSSQLLYEALSGKTNYTDTTGGKTYVFFKINQLGNTATNSGYSPTASTYIQDPWNYSYGYSTGDGTAANVPCNGSNFFDLWSTGGLTANPTSPNGTQNGYATNSWIANWR